MAVRSTCYFMFIVGNRQLLIRWIIIDIKFSIILPLFSPVLVANRQYSIDLIRLYCANYQRSRVYIRHNAATIFSCLCQTIHRLYSQATAVSDVGWLRKRSTIPLTANMDRKACHACRRGRVNVGCRDGMSDDDAAYQTGDDHQLFVDTRMHLLIQSLMARTTSTLSEPA